MMKYKGYYGYVSFDDEAKIFHGEIVNTRSVITFQGKNVEELEKAFRDSIDDYLEWCEERKKKPEKPFSGKFMLRISPELHREISIKAREKNSSLNRFIESTLKKEVLI